MSTVNALYECDVTHARTTPIVNRFRYGTYLWLVDLDDLPQLPPLVRPLAGFKAADHLGDPDSSIRANVDRYLAEQGIDLDGGSVTMLGAARVLGHVFNPLSVFWCHDRDGELVCAIAEVHNTYGESHCYLVRPDEHGNADVDKEFYVSPFEPVVGRYQMSLPRPEEELALSITLHRDGQAPFVAAVDGQRLPATVGRLLRMALRHPLAPLVVTARIKRQGIALWLRGLQVSPRPRPVRDDIADLPNRKLRAAIAKRLFHRAVERLPIDALQLVRPEAFYDRLGDSGLIGFGEAYMAGDIDTADSDELVGVMTVLAERVDRLVPPWISRLRRLGVRTQPPTEANTPDGSRSNIARHYDLSNDLFASFLDPTMTYSSALFDRPVGTAPGGVGWDELEAAQHRKIDRLLDAAGVGPGTSLLEIGTGWGELALRAGARGATVRSITLSEEQQALARRRITGAGLDGLVTVDLCDYRAVEGTYDAVVSVEMIEAVGAAYWPTYFETIDRVLAPGGTAALQAITMPHHQMLATTGDYTWIHKYIFPGGAIPSVEGLAEAMEPTALRIADDLSFGPHYAETLRLWRQRFESHSAHWSDDPVSRRMWTFYLAYAEAGFRARYLDVHHLVLRRPTVGRPT